MTDRSQPTPNEKLLAGLSHLLGFWIALLVWIFQRESRYVRFQAMQSIAYSALIWLLGMVVGLLFVLPIFGGVFAMTAAMAAGMDSGDPSGWIALPLLLPTLFFAISIALGLIVWLPRLIATIQTLQGKNFRYPWLSDLVERFLAN